MSVKPSVVDAESLPFELQRRRKESLKSNTTTTQNTKLAACMGALGFPCDCRPVQNVQTGKVVVEFIFCKPSIRPEFKHLRHTVASEYVSGELALRDPTHPLCVMMAAQHNYDRIIEMHRGAAMRLVAKKGASMTLYKPGIEQQGMLLRQRYPEPLNDMALTASVGVLGIPAVQIFGTENDHCYVLPIAGYVLQTATGPVEYATAHLIRRAPTAHDPLRLALEDEEPLHPLVMAYDSLHSRAFLKRKLESISPLLLHEDGGLKALISAKFTGRVMDELTHRFGAPPIP